MCPATPLTNASPRLLLSVLCVLATLASANPADQQVERYLRGHRMDQLLEVQLEARLDESDSDADRAEIAQALSELYLRQLRDIDRDDPYRQVVLIRARSLVDRLSSIPLTELRLELLIDTYLEHENAVELKRLLLLDASTQQAALDSMRETERGLTRLLASIEPDLNRLQRRRTQPSGFAKQEELDAQTQSLQRQSSLAHYYLGWSGYAIAVLSERHVGKDSFIAFGWLLGADGNLPTSDELAQSAIEYEHVARAAIGVAMCYAQSEEGSLAKMWLSTLIESESLDPKAKDQANTQLLRVLAMNAEWYDAQLQAHDIIRDSGDGMLPVADARYIVIAALSARGGSDREQALKLAELGIEQLIERREIGHVVDLYKRFERLPMLQDGFIPNYAKALAELERAEGEDQSPAYTRIAELFQQALRAKNASDYPQQRDDCRLKLAYVLIRADHPDKAIEHCDAVLKSSIDEKTLEEARWVRIGALDRVNTLAGRSSSSELDAAVREYVEQYPSTSRTAKLVLRHATRGTLDPQLAIDTLSTVPENDPIAVPARRTLLQLQYELLRKSRFSDLDMLRRSRALVDWLLEHGSSDASGPSEQRSQASVLQIGIDLSLRDSPPDTETTRRLIEQARILVAGMPSLGQLDPELLVQLIRADLIDDRIENALATLDELRAMDPDRAQDVQMLVLSTLVEQWSIAHSPRVAQNLVDVGSPIIARVAPKPPSVISVQTSALMEVVADAAQFLGNQQDDQSLRQLALRLSRQVLDQGQPSEPGLRRTGALAAQLDEQPTRLEAWLRLLAAYPQDDERWYEARYESLAAMQRVDPARAFDTFKQYKVLNPTLGPAPWNQRIADLFAEPLPGGAAP